MISYRVEYIIQINYQGRTLLVSFFFSSCKRCQRSFFVCTNAFNRKYTWFSGDPLYIENVSYNRQEAIEEENPKPLSTISLMLYTKER